MIRWLFKLRPLVLLVYVVFTGFMLHEASKVHIDAGFEKQLPFRHRFIETFLEYQKDFGGANRILISVSAREGTIFQREFFEALKGVTDAAYYIDGVNRAQIRSLFTPNTRFIEIVDGGFAGGNVVPADFDGSDKDLETVRSNVLKSAYVGRLVSNDFTSAMVSVQLSEIDPTTGEKVDYLKVNKQLEERIREQFESDTISIEIIGFAKALGSIAEGVKGVLVFLAATVLLVGFLIYFFVQSFLLTGLVVLCSLVGVVWNIGGLTLLGYGFDPMSILVPFLVFAIAVSHSIQITNRVNQRLSEGKTSLEASKDALSVLFVPGLVALASDTLGFLTIYLINVPIIQELAVTASLGVLALVFTNLILLPLLISYARLPVSHGPKVLRHRALRKPLWRMMAGVTRPRVAACVLITTFAIGVTSAYLAQGLRIGDLHEGLPELRPESRYNQDSRHITDKFSVGVDILTAIVEAEPNACIDHTTINLVDRLGWAIQNDPNVKSTLSLPQVMKQITAGWNEGHPFWRELSRNQQVLVQSVKPVETSTGLLNVDCSVMAVMGFLKDHRAESIQSVIHTVETFAKEELPDDVNITIRLAAGNTGVMAAVNETVAAAQFPILGWIYGAITILCLLLFRSVRATICVVLPLAVVSIMAYALMAVLEIGLKTSSLPVAALGVGIGVDYGIYIFYQLGRDLAQGIPIRQAYEKTLEVNGSAVFVTGITLALAVSTWIFSELQFQVDMGILFSSMLILNMISALVVVPSLAAFLYRQKSN